MKNRLIFIFGLALYILILMPIATLLYIPVWIINGKDIFDDYLNQFL